jgi:hypothetical protein
VNVGVGRQPTARCRMIGMTLVITVPGNDGKELAPGTLIAILKKAELKWSRGAISESEEARPRNFQDAFGRTLPSYAWSGRADSGVPHLCRLRGSRRVVAFREIGL